MNLNGIPYYSYIQQFCSFSVEIFIKFQESSLFSTTIPIGAMQCLDQSPFQQLRLYSLKYSEFAFMEVAVVAVVVVWMMQLVNSPIGQRCYFSTYTLLSGKTVFKLSNIKLRFCINLWNWRTCCYLFFGEYRIGGSRQCRRWHHHAVYLRCIQGFLQSAPQLILQTLILFKVCYIRVYNTIYHIILLYAN